MANNRMSLKCQCGAERFLAKRFSESYYTVGEPREYVEKLESWLEDHAFCGGGLDHFSIAYECPADYELAPPESSPE